MKVVVLHPGEMGITFAHALVKNNHHVYWVSDGRSQETRDRAESLHLTELSDIAAASQVADVIISICRGGGVMPNAEQVIASGFKGIYVDANYIGGKQEEVFLSKMITQAGIKYVEASVYGWPYPDKTTQPSERTLYLTGTSANAISMLLEGEVFQTKITNGDLTAKDIKRQREEEDKKKVIPHTDHGFGVVEFHNMMEIDNSFIDEWLERRKQVEPNDYTIDDNGFYISRGGYKFTESQIKGAPERYMNLTPDGCPNSDIDFCANLERVMFYCIHAYAGIYPESKDCLWWRSDAHVAVYNQGSGMGMHHDNAIGSGAHNENPLYNVVSGSLILKDSTYGGELIFRFLDKRLKPSAGSAVFYPSSYMGSHAVSEITSGTRISYLEFFGHGSRPGQRKKL